jgi:putative ABC transport system permease protein
MWWNYVKIALRSLLKFRGYTAINLIGLALGLSAGILIMIYVLDELSYDNFHINKDRIYRVETSFSAVADGQGGMNETNGWGVGTALREYPEVEQVMYARSAAGLLLNYEGKRIKQQNHFVSPEFFRILSFNLLRGNRETCLVNPYSVVITQAMAAKYFKNEDALNKSITLADTLQFVVTGIVENVPSNSHIQFDMLLSFSTYPLINRDFDFNGGWGNLNVRNYVLMKGDVDVEAFKAKAANIYMEHAGEQFKNWGVNAQVGFSPLKNIYLRSRSGNGMGPSGSIERVYLVSGIGVFVIVLACINFVNLTTARSVYRAKEVGLRKVVGSTRTALINQFLSESLILTLVAVFIAIALIGLMMPFFNQLLAKNYSLSTLTGGNVWMAIAVLVLLISFLSGYYPALVLSAMRPFEVLKGKLQTSAEGVQLRRSLVVFQFVISICLLSGTFIVLSQLKFMQKQDLGFAKDEIIAINAARVNAPGMSTFLTFKDELKNFSAVEHVSFANSLPGNQGWPGQVSFAEEKGSDVSVSVEYLAVDEHYIETLDLTLVAGRTFESEKDKQDGLVINETAMTMYGWNSPDEAIGKRINSPSSYPAGEVIGVVKDYHQLGLQRTIGPMVMDYNPQNSYLFAIRYKASDTQELLSQLSALWQRTFPGYEFNYYFLDEDFERQYQAEQRLASMFGLFAGIAIVIAIIGLVGLVSFMVVAKTKEIGVRKVLGANVIQLSALLSKEFVVLVVVANAIAIPLTWYFAHQWLQGFASKTPLQLTLFAEITVITIAGTLVTISIQTIRAAMADPINSLRYE